VLGVGFSLYVQNIECIYYLLPIYTPFTFIYNLYKKDQQVQQKSAGPAVARLPAVGFCAGQLNGAQQPPHPAKTCWETPTA
jgi:hypothetical protein